MNHGACFEKFHFIGSLFKPTSMIDDKIEIMEGYETEIECLKTYLIRRCTQSMMTNYDQTCFNYQLANQLMNDREKHGDFVRRIEEEFQRVDLLVSQANNIAYEMQKKVVYKTIIHIPVGYFKVNERNIDQICAVAVEVKQDDQLTSSIWDIEKFQSKFNDLNELYQHWKSSEMLPRRFQRMSSPFVEKVSESFIGVANIYLKALFYNSKLDYIVPIINTQGQIIGSLRVVLDQTESSANQTLANCQINSTTQRSISEGISADIDEESPGGSQVSLEDEGIEESVGLSNENNDHITVKFSIKEVRDLPRTTSEQILCRYTFINPKLDRTILSTGFSEESENSRRFYFDHENEYTFPINDEILSICREGAVSIEIYSQYQSKEQPIEIEEKKNNSDIQEISSRWKGAKRHVQLSLEIQELDTTGQWISVDVDPNEKILSGGLYRLKQGQSKRLVIQLRTIPRSNAMPLTFHAIRSVQIGSISTRKIDAPVQLDSYQDEDLKQLRLEWLDLIEQEKSYLQSQMDQLNQQMKSVDEQRKETKILEQFVRLADEQNIATLPPAGSGIPGAPAAWIPPITVEIHRPLIFLNIKTATDIAGLQATLTDEDSTTMLSLPLIQQASDDNCVIALWDPSIHESIHLNQVTSTDTLIYLIVKVNVLITEPAQMELVLRKRIAVTISKTERWWPGKVFREILNDKPCKHTSVVYEIASMLPRTVPTINTSSPTICTDFIEEYLQHASTIDSLILLDRLRQEFLLAENCAKQQTMKKSKSVPEMLSKRRQKNIFHSPVNSRREPLPLIESQLTDSTPSMSSRRSFLEEQALLVPKPTLQIKHSIDLEDNPPIADQTTLESKYLTPSLEPVKEKTDNEQVGCRVIVNTGHSIANQLGTIRFIGETCIREGLWYGIELDQATGKNNGSIGENVYFQCADNHGLFIRREKFRLFD